MIIEAFFICAMALPATPFTWPRIVSYHATKSEEDKLRDWLHKNNPDADIFIHPDPQADRLRDNGWERVPFNWNGNQIWIQRKPKKDTKLQESA